MSESAFWGSVRAGLTDAADLKICLDRVENMVLAGMPDVNGVYCGTEFWIELKSCDVLPARAGSRVFGDGGLRGEQVVWLAKRARHGGRVFVLARAGKVIWLLRGESEIVKGFNGYCSDELVERCVWWHNGVGKVDWGGLLRCLVWDWD
jgi:hypothetical protein